MSRRLLKEDGFTLPEMLVTIMIMIVVLFALYSIFDMGLRVFSFGNNKVEATENARLGLEKMQREIRAAYPYDKSNTSPDTHLLDNMNAPDSYRQITFANDLGAGNRRVDSSTERITYSVSGTTLQRSVGTGAPQPVVENLMPDDPLTSADETGLKIEYLKKGDGTNLVATASEPEVQVVRITLNVEVDAGIAGPVEQTLTTDVALRNRG